MTDDRVTMIALAIPSAAATVGSRSPEGCLLEIFSKEQKHYLKNNELSRLMSDVAKVGCDDIINLGGLIVTVDLFSTRGWS